MRRDIPSCTCVPFVGHGIGQHYRLCPWFALTEDAIAKESLNNLAAWITAAKKFRDHAKSLDFATPENAPFWRLPGEIPGEEQL